MIMRLFKHKILDQFITILTSDSNEIHLNVE